MLTELRIGNFKAFGATQRIPIKPLTLIFGPNSSGKSSIIHALLLARHVWLGGNPDVRTLAGLAESVDLGGFDQFVHGQNPDVSMKFGLGFALGTAVPRVMHDLVGGAQVSVEVELTKPQHSVENRKAVVATPVILDGEAKAIWRRDSEGREDNRELVRRLNPLLDDIDRILEANPPKEREILSVMKAFGPHTLREDTAPFAAQPSDSLIPRIPDAEKRYREALGDEGFDELLDQTKEWHRRRDFLSSVHDLFVASLVYLGPLRYRPPRMMLEPDSSDPAWHSGGGQAYWRLQQDAAAREAANEVLRRLKVAYRLDVHTWASRDRQGLERSELVLLDERGRMLSFGDVGAGVSQMLPVLVIGSSAKESLVAIEQPEIHLHPALQAELGDVFIESALGPNKNTFLLETHSEHLILRIMRRIRETKQGRLPAGAIPIGPEHVSVVYVEPGPDGSVIREMPLNSQGELIKSWPGGFFEEGFRELF